MCAGPTLSELLHLGRGGGGVFKFLGQVCCDSYSTPTVQLVYFKHSVLHMLWVCIDPDRNVKHNIFQSDSYSTAILHSVLHMLWVCIDPDRNVKHNIFQSDSYSTAILHSVLHMLWVCIDPVKHHIFQSINFLYSHGMFI